MLLNFKVFDYSDFNFHFNSSLNLRLDINEIFSFYDIIHHVKILITYIK